MGNPRNANLLLCYKNATVGSFNLILICVYENTVISGYDCVCV